MTCLLILSYAIRLINSKTCTKPYCCIDKKYELIVLVSWLRVIYVYYFIFVSTAIHFWVVKALLNYLICMEPVKLFNFGNAIYKYTISCISLQNVLVVIL